MTTNHRLSLQAVETAMTHIVRFALGFKRRCITTVRSVGLTVAYLSGFSRSPKMLYLELVNICNADCVFCAYRHDKREKSRLSFESLRRAIDEFKVLGGR